VESIIYKPLDSLWLKASVVGSIWASIEIILGSFLHNLKIPLSGTILSFISVYILISFLQIWKSNGLILRAGLICALMKSISPSAIILGPMIGILSEAILLEFFIFLLGKNLFGYMIGGGFAVLSALLHKIVSLLILYGLNFIEILSALYKFSAKQINLSHIDPIVLVSLIAGIYIITGISAAISGFITGNRYLIKKGNSIIDIPVIKLNSDYKLFSETTRQKYSVYYLLLNLCAIVISLLLINKGFTLLSVLFPLAYISFCIYHYNTSLNRLMKISVWVQFALITLVAAFVWKGVSEHDFFSFSGLITGLKMIFRAVVVIIGFATIGIELKNPLIKSVLYNKGFANLYQALSLSFSALPGIIESLPESKYLFNKSNLKNLQLFSRSESLLKVFENDHLNRPQIIIITGEVRQGKTAFVKDLILNLRKQEIRITGFISEGIDENGERKGFNIIDIQTYDISELCTRKVNVGWFRYGPYYFNPAGIKLGNQILDINNLTGKQLIIIDEIGPVEINNLGWSNAIEKITTNFAVPHLWVVRKSIVSKIIRKWSIGNVYIFDIRENSLKEVENKIMEIISPKQQYD
jgi:nucleoside-triphosphatase THEP1